MKSDLTYLVILEDGSAIFSSPDYNKCENISEDLDRRNISNYYLISD